jgi:hypothetical protein
VGRAGDGLLQVDVVPANLSAVLARPPDVLRLNISGQYKVSYTSMIHQWIHIQQ